jgi:type IV pilus assembly protein PilB
MSMTMIDTAAGQTVHALLTAGLITDAQLEHAIETAVERSSTPLEVLIDSGAVDRRDVVRTAAASAGLAYVDLTDYTVNTAAASLLSPDFARRSNALPLDWEDGVLLVAVPIRQAGNIELKDDLTRLTKSRIKFAVSGRTDIEAKIDTVYRADGEMHELTSDLVEDDAQGEDLANFTEVSAEAPVVRFVNLLITQAITDRASDIHIEPTEHDLRVRYRIDGVLHDAHRSPRTSRTASPHG